MECNNEWYVNVSVFTSSISNPIRYVIILENYDFKLLNDCIFYEKGIIEIRNELKQKNTKYASISISNPKQIKNKIICINT